jgi:hypothetical protein
MGAPEVPDHVYDSCLVSFLLEYQNDKYVVYAVSQAMVYPVKASA